MYCIKPVTIENKRARRGHPSHHPELFVARSIESEVDEILISLNSPSAVSYNLPAGTAIAECTVVPVNADFSDPVVVNRVETTEGSSENPRSTSNSEIDAEFSEFPAVFQHLVDTPVDTEEQRHRLRSILYHRRNSFSMVNWDSQARFVMRLIRVMHRRSNNPDQSHSLVERSCKCTWKKCSRIKSFDRHPKGSEWTSPIVLVKKKDGTTSFCIDYRKVNEVTHKYHYPLPRIENTLENLQGCDRFSSLPIIKWQ